MCFRVNLHARSSPLGPLLDAAGIKLDATDPDSGVTVEGPLGAALRRAAYLYRQPTNEQRINVAASWLTQVRAAVLLHCCVNLSWAPCIHALSAHQRAGHTSRWTAPLDVR